MGSIIKKMSCAVYPEDSDDDSLNNDQDNLLPSEIIKKEYIKNEKNGMTNDHINLKPSQIIDIENNKIKNLKFN